MLHSMPNIHEFSAICSQTTHTKQYPLASRVEKNIPCYSGDYFRQVLQQTEKIHALQQELYQVLQYGAGVLVIERAYHDPAIIQRTNQVFAELLRAQANQQASDHFATAGANGRIWNVLQKHAKQDPNNYIHYYKNPVLTLISEAWLGPHYQMTAQLNVVYPGGTAQKPHRDYHLGFQVQEELLRYPLHVHTMSSQLTLQGAIAHSDMPIESGPTLLLPFSQQYQAGYLAWRDPEFQAYFQENAVQVALQQGDTVFFNPALFHAAGSNYTKDRERSANLLQVSSAFGKAMESVDRYAISQAIYPHLLKLKQAKALSHQELDALLSSSCDGYSFPSNLDTDPPLYGMAPQTQRQLTMQALDEAWDYDQFTRALTAHREKRLAI